MKAKHVQELVDALNPDVEVIVYEESIQIKLPKDFEGSIFRRRYDVEVDLRVAIPDLPEALARLYAHLEEELNAEEPTVPEDEAIPDEEPPASGPDHGLSEIEQQFTYNLGDSSADLPNLLRPSRLNGPTVIRKGRTNVKSANRARTRGLDKAPYPRWGQVPEFAPYEKLLEPILPTLQAYTAENLWDDQQLTSDMAYEVWRDELLAYLLVTKKVYPRGKAMEALTNRDGSINHDAFYDWSAFFSGRSTGRVYSILNADNRGFLFRNASPRQFIAALPDPETPKPRVAAHHVANPDVARYAARSKPLPGPWKDGDQG